MDRVQQIRGVNFTRIEDEQRGTGVIAQEVQAVLPEAVLENADGTLSVAYGNMVGLLIEALKDLNTEMKTLKAEIAALKGQA
jgi:transposase